MCEPGSCDGGHLGRCSGGPVRSGWRRGAVGWWENALTDTELSESESCGVDASTLEISVETRFQRFGGPVGAGFASCIDPLSRAGTLGGMENRQTPSFPEKRREVFQAPGCVSFSLFCGLPVLTGQHPAAKCGGEGTSDPPPALRFASRGGGKFPWSFPRTTPPRRGRSRRNYPCDCLVKWHKYLK